MKYELPKLPYEYDALEPAISKKTIEFHYGKHEQTYINNLNNLTKGTPYEDTPIETIIKEADGALFNNASQAWNHIFYFFSFTPHKSEGPKGKLDIIKEGNAGNPMTKGYTPLLTFDVWEHAYYLDYQNRRADHLNGLWDIIDWKVVEERY